MTSAGRWTIVVMVLAIAGIVALWPRGAEEPVSDHPAGPSRPRSAVPAESDATLATLRGQAALEPCPSPPEHGPAPAGPLAGVNATCLGAPGTVDLGAALAGEATLLNVWASWCVPCREEMPILAEYARRPGAIRVLGANSQEAPSAGLAFMAEIGVRYPSVHDGERNVQDALRFPPVLPVNYLVRPDGSVERITDPLVFRSADQVEAAIRHNLGSTR